MNWQNYQSLELVSESPRQTPLSLGRKLTNLWRSVFAYLAASSEPHVWTTKDATGRLQWNAYDPITKRSVQVSSEAELRIWLEERHYQYHLASH